MEKTSKIYIAGHEGLLGSALVNKLGESGFKNLLLKTDSELNLFDQKQVADFFQNEKPEYVFMAASKSGSIKANIEYPADFIYENLIIQNNIIHNAYLNGVRKLLFFGASCVYPKESPQPIKEEYFLTGKMESTSAPYATAKAAGIMMCRAYNKQFGTDFISAIPATPYGPGDRFDPESSHVLSSLMRKFYEAKTQNLPELVLWGSGEPKREFIFIDDLADACVFIMNQPTEFDFLNIGAGLDLTIKDLANKMKALIGFEGEIKWDTTKPDGAMKKLLDTERLHSIGWAHKTDLEQGLQKTYDWFTANYGKF
ncbi:MAG: GDP-L-fucose synthase [Candidatus Wolfebacteria bacterium]|nr:GDP-L-fucose synthase [Candidatus Wolfebacteria bacterium]